MSLGCNLPLPGALKGTLDWLWSGTGRDAVLFRKWVCGGLPMPNTCGNRHKRSISHVAVLWRVAVRASPADLTALRVCREITQDAPVMEQLAACYR